MEWLTQLNDVLATRWAELVAIFGLSGIGIILVKFVVKLILNKVEASIKRKYNSEVFDRFKNMENNFANLETNIDQRLAKVEDNFKAELDAQKEHETLAKQELYKKLTNTEVEEVVIDCEISSVELQEVKVEEFIEPIEEVAQNENIEAKTPKKVAKRVINE